MVKAGTEVYTVYKPLLKVVKSKVNYFDSVMRHYVICHTEYPFHKGQIVNDVFTDYNEADTLRRKYERELRNV